MGAIQAGKDNSRSGFSPENCAIDTLSEILSHNSDVTDILFDRWKLHEAHVNTDLFEEINSLEFGCPIKLIRPLKTKGLSYLIAAITIWRLAANAASLENDDDAANSPPEYWQWFENLLVCRDPEILAAMNPYSKLPLWVEQTIGVCLLGETEPINILVRTWKLLEEQRIERTSGGSSDSWQADYPSRFLARVMLGALDMSIAGGDHIRFDATKVKNVWVLLFDIAWDMSLQTVSIDPQRSWENLLINVMARMPKALENETIDEIKMHTERISSDPYLVVSAAWIMWRNGTNVNKIISWFELDATSLMDALDQYDNYAQGAGRNLRDERIDEFEQVIAKSTSGTA